jgi:hypothetical protein
MAIFDDLAAQAEDQGMAAPEMRHATGIFPSSRVLSDPRPAGEGLVVRGCLGGGVARNGF